MLILCNSVGPKDCKIAIVGEAPGVTEMSQGVPFVGQSGRLLNKLLAAVGIVRTDCYLTNVIKNQPLNNDITSYVDMIPTKGRAPIRSAAYDEYEAYLLKELSETTANVIVACGGVALYALTGIVGITRYRGSILSGHKELRGRKVIPILHPAFALRNPEYEHTILQDLRRVREDSLFPELRLPNRELSVLPSFSESMAYIKHCQQCGNRIAVDIETINKQVSCIALSDRTDFSMCIPFYYKGQDYFTPPEELEIWLEIEKLLEDPSVTKIFQNAIFDTYALYYLYGIITNNVEDTMIAHYAILQDLPKGLDFLCSMFTREPYYKDDGKEAFRGRIPDYESYYRYNARDAAVLHEILDKEFIILKRFDNFDTYRLHVEIIPILNFFQAHGIRLDLAQLLPMLEASNISIASLTAELHKMVGYEINTQSPAQLMKYFYDELKIPAYTKRAKAHGMASRTLDDDALKRIARKGYKEAVLLREIRKKSKLTQTYLEMDFDEDQRVRSGYNPVGTVTGRLSSRKSYLETGGNMQNLPPEFKRFLVADIGKLFFEIDLSQAENRIVAWVAPEPRLKKAFIDGIDVHRLTASLIFNIPYEEVSDEPGSSPLGDGTKSQRYWGKQCNHALNYGLGYKKFALRQEMKEPEANILVEKYHATYPRIRQAYHINVDRELRDKGYLTNPFGRKRRFLMSREKDYSTEAFSFIPQSTVGDIVNRWALCYFIKEFGSDPAISLVNQVHDSIVGQFDLSDLPGAAQKLHLLCQSMSQPIPYSDPFSIPVDIKIGPNLKDMNKLKIGNSWETLHQSLLVYMETHNGPEL